jgi:hypothetical protein
MKNKTLEEARNWIADRAEELMQYDGELLDGDDRCIKTILATLDTADKCSQSISTKLEICKNALELIACGKRPDGTYNRCREACEQLAKETLEKIKE